MNETAPYVKGSDTSQDAAESMAPHLARLQSLVWLMFLNLRDGTGWTDDELEIVCAMSHQTASARRRELVLKGLIEDSGERRKTRSGRKATVWKLKAAGAEK